jgi:hypothetical protein
MKEISFCISTNGLQPSKTMKTISSIERTMLEAEVDDFEIIVSGNVSPFGQCKRVKLISRTEDAEQGKLALLRNSCYEVSEGEIVVFLDDDILLDRLWYTRLITYSSSSKWQILGNRILLPNGERYWDRVIHQPHQMVPYDFDETDRRLYQTGCFWIIKRNVLETHQWDSDITYYTERMGGINEDMEFSRRLIKAGHILKFDALNTVWHWDESYRQENHNSGISICVKNTDSDPEGYKYCDSFKTLLESL